MKALVVTLVVLAHLGVGGLIAWACWTVKPRAGHIDELEL